MVDKIIHKKRDIIHIGNLISSSGVNRKFLLLNTPRKYENKNTNNTNPTKKGMNPGAP
jgi:hypothetical protein